MGTRQGVRGPNRSCLKSTSGPQKSVDRRVVSSELGMLVASCGFKTSAPELYVRKQLTFKVCSMRCFFWEGEGFKMQPVTATFSP